MWTNNTFFYSCNGTATIQNNGTNGNVIELFGMHKDGWNSTELQSISLKDQNLISFPTAIVQLLPNLQEIALSFNSITRITNNHLKPFSYLKFLIMDHNRISYLDGNFFHGVNSLFLVDFSYNNIKHMVVDYTWPMIRMDFRHNACIDEALMGVEDSEEERECFKSHIRNQCAPLQPTTGQSLNISESVNFTEKSDSFIDHTTPRTRISQFTDEYISKDLFSCLLSSMVGASISEHCKEMFALFAGLTKSSLRYLTPEEIGDGFDGTVAVIRLSPFKADMWGPLNKKVNKTLAC